MARLKNPQWERLAQGLADGLSRPDAYLKAGYKCAKANANRVVHKLLKDHPEIETRAEEILDIKRRREIDASREAMKELKIEKRYVLEAALETLEKSLGRKKVNKTRSRTIQVVPKEVLMAAILEGKKEDDPEVKKKAVLGVETADYQAYQPDLPVATKMVELLGREHGLFIETKVIKRNPIDDIPEDQVPDALEAIRQAIAHQEGGGSGETGA